MMGIQNVTRRVDTVIVEMDISTAEKLSELLSMSTDETGRYHDDFSALYTALGEAAEVRQPSNLYRAEISDEHYGVIVRDTYGSEVL